MTIWGRQAQEFSSPPESIIAVKGAKVSDFNGRSLSLFSSSMMQIDPDLDEAHSLAGWYKNVGRSESFQTHASLRGEGGGEGGRRVDVRKTLGQVKDEQVGMGETPEYFSCLATVVFIRQENVSYPACRTEGCRKKVVEDGSGQWRCERCDKSWDTPLNRYPTHPIPNNPHVVRGFFVLLVNGQLYHDGLGQRSYQSSLVQPL
jgi:replication factor A1